MLSPDQLIDISRRTWARLSPTLTSNTARYLVETWTELMPDHAIRMRTTIQQAAWAGLTTMIVIGRAMILYGTFLWPNITRAFTTEMNSFVTAVERVGNDQYYGFGKNIEVARSTLFKNIGYVAKELLIRGNNER